MEKWFLAGNEKYTLFVKDLSSGRQLLKKAIEVIPIQLARIAAIHQNLDDGDIHTSEALPSRGDLSV